MIFVVTPRVERPLPCDSDVVLGGTYRTRFFLRIAFVGVGRAVRRSSSVFLVGPAWVYYVGGAVTLLGFARVRADRRQPHARSGGAAHREGASDRSSARSAVPGRSPDPADYARRRMQSAPNDVLERYGVAAHARLRPDKVAIVAGDRRITYGEVDAAATGVAHVLHARGVGPDARLGIALRNRPEWMIAALGAARLGAQVVPIPHGATAEERAYFCEDGEVAFLLDEAGLDAVPRRGRGRADRRRSRTRSPTT